MAVPDMLSRRPKILVIDVGGTHVKVLASGRREPREIPSGPSMDASGMVAAVKRLTADWRYDVVSIGYRRARPAVSRARPGAGMTP